MRSVVCSALILLFNIRNGISMKQNQQNSSRNNSGNNSISPITQIRLNTTLFLAHGSLIAANVASFTLMPIIATQLVGESAAGVPSTISMVGRALAGYPTGWLMAKLGRRLGLGLGYLSAVVGGLLAFFSIGWESFFAFCLGMGLLGAGRATSEQARFVAAEITRAENRAKVLGFIVAAGIVGGVGGPLLVAPTERLLIGMGYPEGSGAYGLTALLAVIALVLIMTLLYPEPQVLSRIIQQEEDDADPTQAQANRAPVRSFMEIMSEPRVMLAMASLVIGQFVMVWLMVIMSVHMKANAHTLAAIALVIAYHNAGMYAFSWAVGFVVDRIGHVSTIIAGTFILAMSTIMSPLSAAFPNLAAAMFLVGLGWSFTYVAGSSLLSDALSPDERSQIQGASESLLSIAGGLGSLGTGVIYALGGMAFVGVLGLVVSIVLILFVVWYRFQPQTVGAS